MVFTDDIEDPEVEVSIGEQYRRLQESDPLQDAERAFARGDYRFASILGEGLVAPGVQREADVNYETKAIVWTRDYEENSFHIAVEAMAFEYASSYNRHLILLFNQSSKH